MAWTKDYLDCQKRRLIESTKLDSELLVIALTNLDSELLVIAPTNLDSELLVIAPTNQPSATTSSAVTPPPCDNEGGSTETRPALAPYSDGDVLMGNIDDSVTNDLYQ